MSQKRSFQLLLLRSLIICYRVSQLPIAYKAVATIPVFFIVLIYMQELFHRTHNYAGFFFDFAERACFDVLAGLLLALGKVPELVPVDEQVFSLLAADKAAAGGNLEEVGAKLGELGVVHDDAFPVEVNVLHFLLTLWYKRMQN